MSDERALRVEKDGSVTTVFLDRPEKRNALNDAAWNGLRDTFAEIDADPDCRAVVLAGAGDHFTVGLDLTSSLGDVMSSEGSPAERGRRIHAEVLRLQDCVSAIERTRQPVIAAVHGYCIGGGIDIITACDVRLAARNTTFSVRETRIAIVADLGTLQRLPGIVGRGHANELVLTGADFDADRAERIGLVNHVHEDGAATLEAAREMARQIAALSPLAVQGSKQVMAFGRDKPVADGLAYVAAWNSAFLLSNDLGEAMAAFFEKRPPRYTGS